MDAISFGTDGWRATLEEFTAPRLRMVAQAVADHLDAEGVEGAVAVGYDAREHSRGFAEECARVLAASGRDVLVSDGDCPTPATVYNVVDRGLAGAMVITASHNPPEYNGVKFFPADGAPAMPETTDDVEARLAEPDPLPESEWGEVREVDFDASHREHCLELVDADLEGVTVVYDAMHGSGREATPAVLERAGAEVVRRRCEHDPEFGGGSPEPSPEKLQGLADAVREHDADLGLANDGDADRIALATPDRGFLDENLFFAALYDHLLEDDDGPAVRSVSTTFLVDRVAAAHGEDVVEVPVGFKWVAEAMVEHDGLLGGEESGGFTVRGHVPEKDGVLMALFAADAEATEPLDDRVDRLLAEHGEVHQGKVSVDCPDDRKRAVLDALGEDIPEDLAGTAVDSVNDADGFKLMLADGSWVLVRPSGTEPKLRVYAEADSDGRVDELLAAGRDVVEPLV
jgi:phosphomannomutase